MRFNKYIKYIILIMFLFVFNINRVNAASDITCKYEMYPVGYYTTSQSTSSNRPRSGVTYSYQEKATHTAMLSYAYSASTNKYSIKHSQSLTSTTSNTVKDSNFNKSVKKSGKCPDYIYATGTDLKEITSSELLSEVNSLFSSNVKGYKYPMVLVEQNGKTQTTPTTFLLNNVMTNWNKIISNQGSRKNIDSSSYVVKAASTLKTQILSSTVGKSVSSNLTNWKTFSNFVTKYVDGQEVLDNEEKLEQTSSKIKSAASDYCSLYCSETKCKSYTNSSAKSQCESSCNTTDKPKCDSAYNSCKDISSSTDQTNCIQVALKNNGLDSSYTSTRTTALSNLQSEAKELQTLITNARTSDLKVTIGEGYKASCDDVSMFHDLWTMVIIAAPGILIVMVTLDFLQAIIAGDEQKMKKAWQKVPKRLFALVLLILIPQLISIILSISNDETASDSSLMYCIINGGE